MVLLIRMSPCTSSGKWRLLTNSRPAVGRTIWALGTRLGGSGANSPNGTRNVAGDIQRRLGSDVSAKKSWPKASKAMPQGLGMLTRAVRSSWRRWGE